MFRLSRINLKTISLTFRSPLPFLSNSDHDQSPFLPSEILVKSSKMAKTSIAALCILVVAFGSAVNAVPVENDHGHQLIKRNSDMTSMLATLATQFFAAGGQKGVNELQTASDKPGIIQKYLGSALSGNNVSGLLSGDNQGGVIQMLIQKILSMFTGAAAGLTGAASSPSVAGSAVGASDTAAGTGGKHSMAGDLLKAAAQQIMAPKA